MPSSKKAAKKAAKRAKAEEASKKRALARTNARAAAKSSEDSGLNGEAQRFMAYNSESALDQLHQAARYGDVATVEKTLEMGLADVDITGQYEGKPATALLLAATGRQVGTTAALLQAGADPKFRTTDGPILHLSAAIPSNAEVLMVLTAHPDIDVSQCCPMGRTPLSWAARFGDAENVVTLIDDCGANVSWRDVGPYRAREEERGGGRGGQPWVIESIVARCDATRRVRLSLTSSLAPLCLALPCPALLCPGPRREGQEEV